MKKKLLAAVLVIAMVLTFIVPMTVSADWEQQPDESWKYYSEQNESYFVDGVYWIDDNAYYFDENGIRQSGWVQNDQGEWFFSHEDGVLLTGWQTGGNNIWFYFDSHDCHRYESGTYVIDGKEYTFSDTGVCENKLENDTGTSTYPSMQGGSGAYPSMQGGSGAYPSMQGGSGAYPSMQGGSGAYPSMQGGSGAYPSMQGGSGAYPSMQGGTGAYGSMQGSVAVYPSMQNGVDISGAIYSVTPVYKTIEDETAANVSQIPSKDLHFIQEWKVESNVYPLSVTFFVAGAQNNTIYVFSDDENGWTKMNKGAGNSLTVTFTHDTRAAVYVGPSLLTYFQIDDVEIMENTGGYMTSGYDPYTGTNSDYYFYNLEMQVNIFATFVYDGRTYSGTWNEIGDIFRRQTGASPEQWLSYNQSNENRWTVGNTYQVTGCLMGLRDTFNVTIKECKLESIEIADLEIIENTCGYWDTYASPAYYYYFPSNSNNLQVTVVYDGVTYSDSWNNIQNTLEHLTGTWPNLQITSNDDQYVNHWTVGNHYTVTGELLGKTDTFDVIIKESPLDSIEIADFEIIENTLGYWTNDYNDGQQSPRYFCYQPGYSNDYQITVVYDGTTYSGSWRDVSDTLYQLTGEWNNMEFTTDPYQSYENRWTVGNTYTVTARFLGKTDVVNVTIVPSPISDFHIDDMEIIAGTCGYWSSSVYNGSYFIFSPEQSRSFKATYTLNGETYTAYNAYDLPEITNERIEIDNNAQYGSPWVVGGTYPVTARLLGAECTFNVTIVENLLTSFEVEDLHILEHTNGAETSDRGPDSDLGKYFRYSTVESPLTIKIVYDNETVIGNETEISQFLTEKLGTNIYVNSSWDNQSSRNPWTAGHTYEGRSSLLDRECLYSVTIDSAVDPVAIIPEQETDVVMYLGHYYAPNIIPIKYEPDNADVATEWTSGDSSIVSISTVRGYMRPYVSPVSVGQTVITAKSKSNPNLSVTFNVTVVDEAAPVGTYTTTATFGPKLPGANYPTVDPDKAVVNPDVYFLRTNSDCVAELEFTSDSCIPLGRNWFDNLTICDVTPISGMGGQGNDGSVLSRSGFLITAKKAGKETLKIGNNYEVVLEVGDYAITFEDENGEVLEQHYVAEGEKPVYTGETPVKEADDQFTYIFAGWTPEIVAATEDTTYTATYQVIEGHQYKQTSSTVTTEPTCTDPGEKTIVFTCEVCGETYTEHEVIPAKGHAYGEWVVTKEATCTEAGSREKVCANCNDKVTETIAALGHTWEEEYTVDKEATCTEDGSKSIHCAVCGEIKEGTVQVIEKKGHAYGDWIVTKAATCTEAGSREKICANCNDKVTETIAALGHTWEEEYTVDKEATCTEDGSKSIHCAVCGEIKEGTVQVIEKKGHAYGDWIVTKAATCTEAGSREKVCANCNDKVTETIPATGHDMSKIAAKEATFTEDGNTEYWYCSNCKKYFSDEEGQKEIKENSWIIPKKQDRYNHYTGIVNDEGTLTYLTNGLPDTSVSGVYKYTDIWCYVKNGYVDTSYEGVEKNQNGWWCIHDGKVDFSYTGFERNANGWWYIEKGQVKFDKNDIINGKANTDPQAGGEDGWWLVRGGKVVEETTVANNANGWWFVRDGKVDFDYTGVQKNDNGWWAIIGGKVDFNYTGFSKNENGWWYCEKGQVKFDKNDIISGKANIDPTAEGVDGWWYVRGSQVIKTNTVASNAYGWWFVRDGKVDFGYTGVQNNDNGWWYIKDGKVDFNYTGFGANEHGWWYCEKGQVKFNKNDIISGKANTDPAAEGVDGWWYVKGSQVIKTDTVAQNAYGWWAIFDGKVDFTFTGLADNEYGTWYCVNGKVDFSYTGPFDGRGIVNGKAS